MLKIGAFDWGECGRCAYFDEEHGCSIIDNITVTRKDEAVYCIDGEAVDPDYAGTLEFEGPWK